MTDSAQRLDLRDGTGTMQASLHPNDEIKPRTLSPTNTSSPGRVPRRSSGRFHLDNSTSVITISEHKRLEVPINPHTGEHTPQEKLESPEKDTRRTFPDSAETTVLDVSEDTTTNKPVLLIEKNENPQRGAKVPNAEEGVETFFVSEEPAQKSMAGVTIVVGSTAPEEGKNASPTPGAPQSLSSDQSSVANDQEEEIKRLQATVLHLQAASEATRKKLSDELADNSKALVQMEKELNGTKAKLVASTEQCADKSKELESFREEARSKGRGQDQELQLKNKALAAQEQAVLAKDEALASLQSQVDGKESQCAKLSQEIDTIKAQYEASQGALLQAQAENASLTSEGKAAAQEAKEMRERLAAMKADLDQSRVHIEDLQEEVGIRNDKLERQDLTIKKAQAKQNKLKDQERDEMEERDDLLRDKAALEDQLRASFARELAMRSDVYFKQSATSRSTPTLRAYQTTLPDIPNVFRKSRTKTTTRSRRRPMTEGNNTTR